MIFRPAGVPACTAALAALAVLSGCAASAPHAKPVTERPRSDSPSPSAVSSPRTAPTVAAPIVSNGPVILPQNLPVSSSVSPQAPKVLPLRIVTLTVGQTLTVRYEQSDSAVQWAQTASSDAVVLGQPVTTTGKCPAGYAGCSPTATATYTAKEPGTTVIRWSFLARGYCPSCPEAIQTIKVTVRR